MAGPKRRAKRGLPAAILEWIDAGREVGELLNL
jgi:hypothetical protein